jgi:hypothetical protein
MYACIPDMLRSVLNSFTQTHTHTHIYICMHICMHVYLTCWDLCWTPALEQSLRMKCAPDAHHGLCVYVCVFIYILHHVCVYVYFCMYVYMYKVASYEVRAWRPSRPAPCVYVCMYVCMYVYICNIYIKSPHMKCAPDAHHGLCMYCMYTCMHMYILMCTYVYNKCFVWSARLTPIAACTMCMYMYICMHVCISIHEMSFCMKCAPDAHHGLHNVYVYVCIYVCMQ